MASITSDTLQLWAGLECTINRVGDHWSNQAHYNGHDERGVGDLDLIAELGIRAIRYPVLWEAVAPRSLDDLDWERTDERLEHLRTSGTEVIAGLLHHGSGPEYTSLVDSAFPTKLARYAGEVARRYPWIEYWTPVNEPLTTARFSGLYGVWYPHGNDDSTFIRCLYNEVRGTVEAMRTIREVNPDAKLVQTDDLGRATGTAATRRQVEFENERRWLTFDLLLGHVGAEHPLYDYLTGPGGLSADELGWLEQNPCPPDIMGVNHYLLSNRFLDDELFWYPDDVPRGTAFGVDYVDVPALETARADAPGVCDVLRDVWQRYPGTEFAITEVHLDGDDDVRQRWLWEVWLAAEALRDEGAPLLAVTAWSLLGTFDWNTLCTTPPGGDRYYEPGVFDVSGGQPRPTALAEMVRSLAENGSHEHPSLDVDGYWATDERLRYGTAPEPPVRASNAA
jgi:dTDP-4-dehydrorhamnose reductase